MAKKQSASSVQDKRLKKSGKHISDSKIDFSDIPELEEGLLAKARRVGRPRSDNPKQLIALRIAPDLLASLRKLAKRRKKAYQTLMHELLEKAISDVA